MKIALVAAPFVEVPPRKYGGTERIVDAIGNGLINLGQDVTMFAPGESSTRIPLRNICDVALFNDPNYNHDLQRWERLRKINRRTMALIGRENPDIVHVHDYDNPDLISKLSGMRIPTLVSIGHAKTPVIANVFEHFGSSPTIFFNALTKQHARQFSENMPWIFNGIDFSKYEIIGPNDDRADYFLSIGDMKPIKGHSTAIKLAKELDKNLVIVGAPYYRESVPYFNSEVYPFVDLDVSDWQKEFLEDVVSGKFNASGEIIYFGNASDEQKKILYRHAQFTQFLGHIEKSGVIEAFGLTMIESLASGTPILGSVGPAEEIIQNGGTGAIVTSLEGAVNAINRLNQRSPTQIRDAARISFDYEAMTKNYLELYHRILNESA